MTKYKIVFMITALVFLFSNALAQEETVNLAQLPGQAAAGVGAASQINTGIQGKISLDLRNIEVVDALKFLAMKAGLNIIATKNVAGRITLIVNDVPVKDIFDIMLRSNGLAYAKKGNIYNVMTEDEYETLFGKKFSDIRQVKSFRIKYAIPEQVFSLMDTLKSDIGRILVEPDSGTALIMDTPERISEIQKALTTMENKNLVEIFQLKYARAKEVETQLKAQLDAKKVGSVKADERSNQLIVQALPERMQDVARLINALDKKTKEVLIDAKIVKIKLSDQLTSGIEWEGLFDLGKGAGLTYLGSYPFSVLQASTEAWQSRQQFRDAQSAYGVGAYPFSGNSANVSSSTKLAPGESMHVGQISTKQDFDTVIKYLKTLGNTQILSNPKLAVINNEEAKILVGERQAYVTTTTTTGQTTTTVSEEVTFVDVGIQLAVTPTINDDNYVTMKVKPEISSVISTLVTPTGNKIPIIDTSTAETTVMVKDGTTIVLGGLRKEEKTSSSDQVPILGKIPLLRFLFSSGTKKTERTELLVMLTPHIVSGDTLTTGEEHEFAAELSKEYKEYRLTSEQPDFNPPEKKMQEAVVPENVKIRPYIKYSPFKETVESGPNVK